MLPTALLLLCAGYQLLPAPAPAPRAARSAGVVLQLDFGAAVDRKVREADERLDEAQAAVEATKEAQAEAETALYACPGPNSGATHALAHSIIG